MNKHFFQQRHPLVISCYYLLMLLIAMSTTNPLIISCLFLGSLTQQLIYLNGKPKYTIIYPLFFWGVITLTNPLFVHRGGTILFFFLNKPITLEAFVYGFFMGMMITAVIYLFQNFQSAVDSEQLFYLFGRRFSKATMILTMVFRFIPLFQQYYQELNQVQKHVQRTQKRTFKEKVSYGLDLFGNLFSWALENGMDTADSMKARGYGVGVRSSRITYRWKIVDTLALIMIVSLSCLFLLQLMQGNYEFNYYPYRDNILLRIEEHSTDYLLFIFLAFLPALNRVREVIIWTILKSKI